MTSSSLRSRSRRTCVALLVFGLAALAAALIAPAAALAAAPTVTKISPPYGPPSGGTVVTVTGTELTGVSKVEFGSVVGTEVTEVSATTLTVKSPGHAEGKVDVIVTTGEGASSPSAAGEFTYIAAHPPKEIFGSVAQPTFGNTYGLAVQSNGDLLVINKGSGLEKVERFNPDGTASDFTATAGSNALSGFSFGAAQESQVAVDDSSGATAGNIYVAQKKTTPELKIFDSEGNEEVALTEYSAGPNAEGTATSFTGGICGVTVDPSGNLYIAEYGTPGQIHEYSPSHAVPGVADNIHNFSAEKACGLAAGAGPSAGSLFVDQEGAKKVFKYTAGVADYEVASATLAIFALAVDPSDGNVLVAGFDGTLGTYISEIEASGASATELSRTRIATGPNGVAANLGGNVYASRNGLNHVEVFAPIDVALTLAHTGEGTLVAECEEGSGYVACAAPLSELPTGTEVKVTATPEAGSELTGLSGTRSAAGTCTHTATSGTCSFKIEENSSVEAAFEPAAPPSFELHLTTTGGTGSGSFECEVAGTPGPCAAAYEEGTQVKVIPHEATGSKLKELTGDCTGTGPCVLTMNAEHSVNGVFDLEPVVNPTTLVAFKGGNEHGTIKSLAPDSRINCGTECDAVYEEGEAVELEAEAASGSVLAGWLGCHPVVGQEQRCRVTLSGKEVDVTAVFITEGSQGQPGLPGANGKNIVVGTATPTECAEGGITVEVEGEPETKNAICDGGAGAPGSTGAQGPQGAAGPQGVQGLIGPNGPQGAAGAQGSEGKQGAQGPAGKNGKVTCKVQQQKNGKKVKVTCTVKYSGGQASASALSWRLATGGHVIRHGRSTVAHLDRVLAHLRPGRYLLHLNGRKTTIVIPAGR